MVPEVRSHLPSLFGDILSGPDLAEFLGDGTYDGVPAAMRHLRDEAGRLSESHSLAEGPVRRRITVVMLRKSPRPGSSKESAPSGKDSPEKEASMEKKSAARFLAREYGKYLLSFCRNQPEDIARMAVVQKSV